LRREIFGNALGSLLGKSTRGIPRATTASPAAGQRAKALANNLCPSQAKIKNKKK